MTGVLKKTTSRSGKSASSSTLMELFFGAIQMIPGARQTIDALRHQGHPLLFITNALESPEEQVARLARINIEASLMKLLPLPNCSYVISVTIYQDPMFSSSEIPLYQRC